MDDDATRQAKLAILQKELEAIHIANKVYWSQKKRSHDVDMDHQKRQERLDKIRREMNELENG